MPPIVMDRVRVGVVGATGYSGAVAARLLATHPRFDLAFCTSDARAGQPVAAALGLRLSRALEYAPNAEAGTLGRTVDAVLLATSAEVSARLVPSLLGEHRVVVDFSGAFRLATGEDFARWYKLTHPRPDLLAEAHYGLPELFGVPARTEGAPILIANPGCYPTAALLALAPLLRAGLIDPKGIIVDAKSGVSGAGRQANEEYSFVELQDDVRAYRLLAHQHTPEIARHLARAAGIGAVSLTFTPHLVPVRRGILATCYARPTAGVDGPRCKEALVAAYRESRFVEVVAPEEVTLGGVVGTNYARVGVAADRDTVVVVAAIDNLLKGAAGQAVQTLNRLFGNADDTGLDHLHRIAP